MINLCPVVAQIKVDSFAYCWLPRLPCIALLYLIFNLILLFNFLMTKTLTERNVSLCLCVSYLNAFSLIISHLRFSVSTMA